MLTLGIPGSPTAAVLLGGLMIWGLQPGPMLFVEHKDFVWGLIASMYLGNIVGLLVVLTTVPYWAAFLRIPFSVIAPVIVVICAIGAYTVHSAMFDVVMMMVFGVVDFASTVPFYLQLIFPGADLRVLRMFRLLRIFKLSRYNSAMDDMFAAIKAEKDSFSSAMFLLLISCLLFSSLIYIIEGQDQPDVFPSIPAAMHWFILTIISGWGNVDPVTFLGVVLVVVTQILAIALAAILTGVVATAYTAQVQRRESEYELQVREVLADGVVTEEERLQLKQMQAKFGMTDEQVEAIAEQVRQEKAESTVKL